jgi:hypothetical protein
MAAHEFEFLRSVSLTEDQYALTAKKSLQE